MNMETKINANNELSFISSRNLRKTYIEEPTIQVHQHICRVSPFKKYPLRIKILCDRKKIMHNTLSPVPLEYIIDEEDDDSVLTAKMAESIKDNGMIYPITVYKDGKRNFKIIDGKRRFLATKMLGRNYIDCLILCCNEKTGEYCRKSNVLRKAAANYIEALKTIKQYEISENDLTEINNLLPEINFMLSSNILNNSIDLNEADLKFLEKFTIIDSAQKIISVNDDRKRYRIESSSIDMLNDYKQLIDNLIKSTYLQVSKNETIIIKDSILLFNSLDSFVKKITGSRLNIEVKKQITSDFCEYDLIIKQ